MHSAGNKSQVCKMERLHCFVFAQDYHCSCHLHSPTIIIIVAIVVSIVVTIAIVVIVINIITVIIVIIVIIVVIIIIVISLDSSQVALVAPGVVCQCMVQSGLSAQHSTLLLSPPQFLTVEMCQIKVLNCCKS